MSIASDVATYSKVELIEFFSGREMRREQLDQVWDAIRAVFGLLPDSAIILSGENAWIEWLEGQTNSVMASSTLYPAFSRWVKTDRPFTGPRSRVGNFIQVLTANSGREIWVQVIPARGISPEKYRLWVVFPGGSLIAASALMAESLKRDISLEVQTSERKKFDLWTNMDQYPEGLLIHESAPAAVWSSGTRESLPELAAIVDRRQEELYQSR